jgi:hypothetical protein
LTERVREINEIIAINRILKSITGCQCIVKRIKFYGPDDPMEILPPPEDGSEPEPIDEERKAKEFKLYTEFAKEQKKNIL